MPDNLDDIEKKNQEKRYERVRKRAMSLASINIQVLQS